MVTEKLIKEWYNKKHSAKGEGAWRPLESYFIFLNYLDAQKGRKLLDVGCGTGYLLRAADQRGLETYGVDISDEGVKIAKKVSPRSKISIGKGEQLKFPDSSFDYVTCLGALEHFLNIENGVKEMVRVAKDGSRLCMVVPNVDYFFWRGKKRKGTEQQDINENLLTLDQWKSIFLKQGLAIEKIYQDRWLVENMKVFASKNMLEVFRRALYKLIWFFLPLGATYQFIFILRKPKEVSGEQG